MATKFEIYLVKKRFGYNTYKQLRIYRSLTFKFKYCVERCNGWGRRLRSFKIFAVIRGVCKYWLINDGCDWLDVW
jgi:hypothetical protein